MITEERLEKTLETPLINLIEMLTLKLTLAQTKQPLLISLTMILIIHFLEMKVLIFKMF